jgi:hypothetical protein
MPKLTAASVDKHSARKTRREISDAACPGLYLVVQTSGAKSFAMRFRNQYGRHVKLTLGRLDVTGVESTTAPMIGMPLDTARRAETGDGMATERALGNDVVADVAATGWNVRPVSQKHSRRRYWISPKCIAARGTTLAGGGAYVGESESAATER